MFGQATLEIPRSGTIGPSLTDGLSDTLAMIMGCSAAWTLSESDGHVIVTLGSRSVQFIIGHNTILDELIISEVSIPTL